MSYKDNQSRREEERAIKSSMNRLIDNSKDPNFYYDWIEDMKQQKEIFPPPKLPNEDKKIALNVSLPVLQNNALNKLIHLPLNLSNYRLNKSFNYKSIISSKPIHVNNLRLYSSKASQLQIKSFLELNNRPRAVRYKTILDIQALERYTITSKVKLVHTSQKEIKKTLIVNETLGKLLYEDIILLGAESMKQVHKSISIQPPSKASYYELSMYEFITGNIQNDIPVTKALNIETTNKQSLYNILDIYQHSLKEIKSTIEITKPVNEPYQLSKFIWFNSKASMKSPRFIKTINLIKPLPVKKFNLGVKLELFNDKPIHKSISISKEQKVELKPFSFDINTIIDDIKLKTLDSLEPPMALTPIPEYQNQKVIDDAFLVSKGIDVGIGEQIINHKEIERYVDRADNYTINMNTSGGIGTGYKVTGGWANHHFYWSLHPHAINRAFYEFQDSLDYDRMYDFFVALMVQAEIDASEWYDDEFDERGMTAEAYQSIKEDYDPYKIVWDAEVDF